MNRRPGDVKQASGRERPAHMGGGCKPIYDNDCIDRKADKAPVCDSHIGRRGTRAIYGYIGITDTYRGKLQAVAAALNSALGRKRCQGCNSP